MKNNNRLYPMVLIIILIILFFNFSIALYEYFDYQKRVNSGNERWKQVEERIKELEAKCDGRNG